MNERIFLNADTSAPLRDLQAQTVCSNLEKLQKQAVERILAQKMSRLEPDMGGNGGYHSVAVFNPAFGPLLDALMEKCASCVGQGNFRGHGHGCDTEAGCSGTGRVLRDVSGWPKYALWGSIKGIAYDGMCASQNSTPTYVQWLTIHNAVFSPMEAEAALLCIIAALPERT